MHPPPCMSRPRPTESRSRSPRGLKGSRYGFRPMLSPTRRTVAPVPLTWQRCRHSPRLSRNVLSNWTRPPGSASRICESCRIWRWRSELLWLRGSCMKRSKRVSSMFTGWSSRRSTCAWFTRRDRSGCIRPMSRCFTNDSRPNPRRVGSASRFSKIPASRGAVVAWSLLIERCDTKFRPTWRRCAVTSWKD